MSFTGGLKPGGPSPRSAAATVKKVALELGGKNPNIVFADADFDAAVDNALNAAFLHSGQVCSAGSRLLVEDSLARRFVESRSAGRSGSGWADRLDEDTETGRSSPPPTATR